jgi:RNA polymerase-binding protein DksA
MTEQNDRQLNELREQLLDRRQHLKQEIHDELMRDGSESAISLAGRVHDAQEESMSAMLTQFNLSMLSQHQQEMQELEIALARIDSGDYGDCIDCGEPIAAARLRAYPTAVRCIECQARHEQG